MRTNEERIRLIHLRTAEIKKEKQKKQQKREQNLLDSGLLAACLLLVIGIGAVMPGVMENATAGTVSYTSGVASMVGNQGAVGYILMGLLSFLLGMCVTIVLYRLRHRMEQKQQEDKRDEL